VTRPHGGGEFTQAEISKNGGNRMSQLKVAAEGTAQATPAVVWALVSDANQYPKWGPWRAGGYKQAGDISPRGVGAIQWFESEDRSYLRRTTSVEKILEIEEGRRIVYTIVKGIPVKNYRAEVTLTAAGDVTHVRWEATWDNSLAGRIVHRKLLTVYPDIVERLIAAAERAESGRPTSPNGVEPGPNLPQGCPRRAVPQQSTFASTDHRLTSGTDVASLVCPVAA
jgi:uncharacterized protein YndB with AHSA1/START domain